MNRRRNRPSQCAQCQGINADGRTRCRKPVCNQSTQYCYIHYMRTGLAKDPVYGCARCRGQDLMGRPCQNPVCKEDYANQYCWIHWRMNKGTQYTPKHPYRYKQQRQQRGGYYRPY